MRSERVKAEEAKDDADGAIKKMYNSEISAENNFDDGLNSSSQPSVAVQPISAILDAAFASGIEFLVQLAERGEIDPKDVDIIYVTDRFLQAITTQPKENLRQSGKVIFHASVLLRMKAEALLANKALQNTGDDFLDFGDDGLIFDSDKQVVARQITLQDLERALVRRAASKANRPRKVTLDELVAALKEAERIEQLRFERKPKAVIQLEGFHQINDVDDLLDLAHDEDIDVTIARAERILVEQVSPGQNMALIDLIIKLGKKSDWVDAFLAILFLANAGKIFIEQSDFYGPVTIVRPPETNNIAPQAEAV